MKSDLINPCYAILPHVRGASANISIVPTASEITPNRSKIVDNPFHDLKRIDLD